MNEAQRQELETIRTAQRFLTARLADLEERLTRLEAADQPEAAIPPPLVLPTAPPPLPVAAKELPPPAMPPPVTPVPLLVLPAEEALPAPTPQAAPAPAPAVPRTVESLEMRIGTTWFVRVGIVLLVTSLAFLGSYLYKSVVPHLGPAAKVGLLYLGAGGVAGFGAWLERSRQARESGRVRSYARVVLAGGLAAVYYVTYIAHFYEKLRVIPSPLVAGGLLLAWAAFMVFLAERRGSETLATVAILLGFYTSAINEGVAGFTLASNLCLTAGAVFLLRRHLWRVFPFASLLATFGSYAFWNYFHSYLGWRGLDVPPVHGGTRFWTECAFLLTYWLLFTWAALTAREDALPPVRRAGFASLNNGAFFVLVTWLVLGEDLHDFWKWSLGFGVVLVALSEAARRLPRRLDANTEGAYLQEGVLLVTLGFVTYFSGWQLSLVLAVQSVTLLAGAGQRRSRLLLGSAYVTGLLSFAWAANRLAESGQAVSWATGLGEGGFLVLAAWWGERLLAKETAPGKQPGGGLFREILAPAPAYFSLLGLAVWLWLIERNVTTAAWIAPVFGLAAVALTASVYLLRVRAIPIYAQAYLLAAYGQWIERYGWRPAAEGPPWWNPLVLLAATLALGHWWQRREARRLVADVPWGGIFVLPNALASVLLLQVWLQPAAGVNDGWIGEMALLALALLAYGLATGYRSLAAAGQWFLLFGGAMFLMRWHAADGSGYHPAMWLTLGPWVGLLLTAAAARHFVPEADRARLDPQNVLGTSYEVMATGLFLAWAGEYLPQRVLFALFCGVGGGMFALGVWRRQRRWRVLSALPTAAGLAIFWWGYLAGEPGHLLDLLGVACLGGQQWWGKQRLRPEASGFPRFARDSLAVAATLCAWALVTSGMAPWHGGAFSLAAAWSGFAAAVFAVGLGLRERLYRWLGLLVLAVTGARVAIVDIWRLDSLERTVSVFCLGITLLGLGYLYNRYHDKWQNLL